MLQCEMVRNLSPVVKMGVKSSIFANGYFSVIGFRFLYTFMIVKVPLFLV